MEQLLFGLVDVETVEVGQLGGLVLSRCQHDGFSSALQEEGTLAEHYFHRDEVVEILVGMVGSEFGKGAQRDYLDYRHHALQQLSHTYQRQCVATYYGYLWLSHCFHIVCKGSANREKYKINHDLFLVIWKICCIFAALLTY